MIKPISEDEAKRLREQLPTPEERMVIFPKLDDYESWINKVSNFILSRDEEIEFGVEKYRGDMEFFTIESSQSYPLIFMSKFVPSELVFLESIGKSAFRPIQRPNTQASSSILYAFMEQQVSLANAMAK